MDDNSDESKNNREVTRILESGAKHDPSVAEHLFPLVYDELRQIAGRHLRRETPGQAMQPTSLVHEVYLRLIGGANLEWHSRGHFFAAAARAMRHILVEQARRRKAIKRGGDQKQVSLDEIDLSCNSLPDDRVLALDEALQKLEQRDPRKGQIVSLRFFSGLTIAETATALGLSATTVKDDWQFARAWLYREMTISEPDG